VIHVASWAAKFLFTSEQLDQPVERLSGGERARVLIAQLMLQPADLLPLDEPTNDLNVESALIEVMGFRRDGKKLFVVGRTDRGELMRYVSKTGQFVPFLRGISGEFTAFSNDGQSQHCCRHAIEHVAVMCY
jgi:ABC-type Mn2+/Zn2+ transport system ATPase subunit